MLYLLYSLICHSEGLLIRVCTSNPEKVNCSLEYYARNIPLANNTVLLLDKGTHLIYLNESIFFYSLTNVSIHGSVGTDHENGSDHATSIQCIGNSGFVFSKVENIHISDLTMTNCGAMSQNDSYAGAAIVMRETFSVTLENVTVKNSKSYGMIGLNMYGYSRIQNSLFSSNSAAVYTSHLGGNIFLSWSSQHSTGYNDEIDFGIDHSTVVGGNGGENRAAGLHVDYHHYCKVTKIAVTNSIFHRNNGGNFGIVVHQVNQSHSSSFTLKILKVYIADGKADGAMHAGGLSFVIKGNSSLAYAATKYYIFAKDSVFIGNINNNSSGGVQLNSQQMSFSSMFSIKFSNCKFINNSGFEGGAMGLRLTNTVSRNVQTVLSSCTFHRNFAKVGGAIFAKTLHYKQTSINFAIIMVRRCVLQANMAVQDGSALLIYNTFRDKTSLVLIMNDTVIQENEIVSWSPSTNGSYRHADATVVLENTETMITNSSFLNNLGSAIHISKSELYFSKLILFINNTATEGGGIQLSNAKLHLSSEAKVIFKGNHAFAYGGAVCVYTDPQHGLVQTHGCFVTRSYQQGPLPGEPPEMIFVNNSAVYGGNTIYGPTEYCFIHSDTASMFNFQDPDKLTTSISLKSTVKVCMCYSNNTPNCNVQNLYSDVYSGSKIFFKVAVIDYKGDFISSVINAKLGASNDDAQSHLTGDLQMTQRHCTDLNFVLSSYEATVTVTLTIVEDNNTHPLYYIVHFLPCPIGFSIQEHSPECVCIPQFAQERVQCNISDQTFQHDGNIWIGTYNNSKDLINVSDTTLNMHTLISPVCPLGYCKTEHVKLLLEHADVQCKFNRSGILCGGCSPGLSTSLGASHCIECESMSGWYTALFVFLFSALGIVLIAFLRLCNLTISQGGANPVMFYANVIHVNDTFFFEQKHPNPLSVFVSWFNLDFGYGTCFYDGMDATAKAWLQFVFPLYLWVMISIVFVASEKSPKFVRIMGRNTHSVILTLLHLSFFKLYRATVAVLLYTDLQNGNREHFRVWRYNGNINYYSKKHTTLLAFASVVLIFFIIPYMLIIICAPLIVRKGYQIRGVNFWRLKPFLDAYTGLYKDKAMFWSGLTTVIFTILSVTSTEVDAVLNLVIIGLSCLSLIFLNFSFGGVYRMWTLSIIEASIHTNMTFLSILSLLSVTRGHSVTSVAYTSTAVSFVIFMAVLIVQCLKELCGASNTFKLKLCSLAIWCQHKFGRDVNYRQHYRYYKSDHHESDKHPFTLSYYLLSEESTGRYYDTGHREDLLTTVQVEEDINDIVLPSAATSHPVVVPIEVNQNQMLPNDNKAVTFSVVALDSDPDTEEMEGAISHQADEMLSVTNSDVHKADGDQSETDIHIETDENLLLLSPYVSSPQNNSSFQHIQHVICHQKSSPFQTVSTCCPLDSDIDATGQRPSLAHVSQYEPLDYMQRLTDPIELAVVDEGESDLDEDLGVKLKIQHNIASCRKGRSSKPKITKQSRGFLKYFESISSCSELREEIPLLQLKIDRQICASNATTPDTEIKVPCISPEGSQ